MSLRSALRTGPRLSLRAKLLLGVVAILAPILGVQLMETCASHERQRAAVMYALVQTAEALGSIVDATFDEAIAAGTVIALAPPVQTLDAEAMVPLLRRLQPRYDAFANVAVYDRSGRLLAESAPGFGPGMVQPERQFGDHQFIARVAGTGEPVVAGVLPIRRTDGLVAAVAVPIAGADGDAIGLVLVDFDVNRLYDRFAAVQLLPRQAVRVFDRTGRLAIAHRDAASEALPWEGRDFSDRPDVQLALTGQLVLQAGRWSAAAQEPVASVLVPTARHGWVVEVRWPRTLAFGPVERSYQRQLLTFGVMTLAALGGALLLADSISRSVAHVKAQAARVGAGNFGMAAPPAGGEFEHLTQAMNDMAGRLQAMMAERDAARVKAEGERQYMQQVLRMVVHDLRAPLTVISGYTQIASQHSLSHERRTRALDAVQSHIRLMNRILGDLLDAMHLRAAGTLPVRPCPMDLTLVLQQVVEAQQLTSTSHRIVLDTPESIEGEWDPDRVAQVLSNLVGNAIKYSPHGSTVRVQAWREQGPDAHESREAQESRDSREARYSKKDRVVVSVTDEGVGIAQEDVEHLFKPFSRLLSNKNIKGIGLGLYISKAIVEAHGGRMWVASPGRGQGATFGFALPAAPSREGASVERREALPAAA